jgi:predicted glycoside hydrolase/deacetylase ChbG (UPF0249 family)
MNTFIKSLLIVVVAVLAYMAVGQADDSIRLIIRGDDFGMTEGSLEAFEQAFNNGVLTCASIQVPAPWFEGAAELCRKNPGWCIGIHLTLVGEWRGYRWRPVLPWDKVPSIVDEDGYLYTSPEELNAHNPKQEEIEAELRAQIELAKKKGITISYLDNHYGAVEKTPGGTELLLRIASDYGLPVSRFSGEQVCSGIYNIVPDQKKQSAVDMLETMGPGLWLWYCHPGIDSPEQNALIHESQADIMEDGGVGRHRTAVLETLMSIEVKSMILKRGIILTDYRKINSKRE